MKNEGTFLCPDCYHIFGGYGDQGCLKCRKHNHFQVDELLAPIIIELNKKGYKTNGCCSGHLFYMEGYIWFEEQNNLQPPVKVEDNFWRWSLKESEDIYQNQENLINIISSLTNYVRSIV